MSTDQDQAREIAERIARRVAAGGANAGAAARHQSSEVSAQLAAVRAGIYDLQRKLAQLEASVKSDVNEAPRQTVLTASREAGAPATHSPWLAGINSSYSHPSEERFGVEEATVSALVDYFEKEKMCSVEPGGKPCDHCAMCSSRGF